MLWNNQNIIIITLYCVQVTLIQKRSALNTWICSVSVYSWELLSEIVRKQIWGNLLKNHGNENPSMFLWHVHIKRILSAFMGLILSSYLFWFFYNRAVYLVKPLM